MQIELATSPIHATKPDDTMKLNRLKFLLVAAAILATLPRMAIARPAQTLKLPSPLPAQLEVKLNKNIYAIGEPIVASLKLSNISTTTLTSTWFSYDNDFYYSLNRADSMRLSLLGPIKCVRDMPTRWHKSILPGESLTTAFDFVAGDVAEQYPYFQTAEALDVGSNHINSVLPPGSYTVTFIQRLPAPSGQRIDIRAIASADFQVRGIDPVEREALHLFRQRLFASAALTSMRTNFDKLATAVRACQQLIEKHPNSAYAMYARYYLGRIGQVQGKHSEAANDYAELLRRHPNFPLRADALYFQAISLARSGEKEKAREIFETLTAEFSNHLIAPNISYKEKSSRTEALRQTLTG